MNEIGHARARAITSLFSIEEIAQLFGIPPEEIRQSPAIQSIQSAARIKVLNELSTTPNPELSTYESLQAAALNQRVLAAIMKHRKKGKDVNCEVSQDGTIVFTIQEDYLDDPFNADLS